MAFHEEFSRLALDEGWLRLWVLNLDSTPAAFVYCLRYRNVVYFYQSAVDELYARHSVGLVAMGLAIRGAFEEGAAEFDFLHGAEPYKFLWAPESRELLRLSLYPPTVRGTACRRFVAFRRTAGQMARLVL